MAILVIIILLLIGGVVGYRIGSHFSRRENEVLLINNQRHMEFSNQWFNAAKQSTELTNTISEQQTTNLSATMQSVIKLLTAFQMQNNGNLNQQQNEKVTQLINQARGITGFHE